MIPVYDRTQLREIIAGRRNGVGPALLRMVASCFEPFYYAGSTWRNHSYDRHSQKSTRVSVPVISIGNITVGGTGKTPMVEWIVCRLLDRGKRPAIISRGYGARDDLPNDEALELAQKLPGVPHVQNADRVAAAQVAIETHGCDCLVLDDAFQHRRIGRDFDVVLIDATEPFGYERLLPRGLLRESLSGLKRADAIVLTRSDAVDESRRQRIWEKIHRYAPQVPVIEAAHAPTNLLNCTGSVKPMNLLNGSKVAAFCGIGNPAAFRSTLEGCGADVVDLRAFPDHHGFDVADIDSLSQWLAGLDEFDLVICTHKDLVKVDRSEFVGKPLFALAIGMRFLAGQEILAARLDSVVS